MLDRVLHKFGNALDAQIIHHAVLVIAYGSLEIFRMALISFIVRPSAKSWITSR